MDIRHCTIWLKHPMGSQDVSSVFEDQWRHFSSVPGMIDGSFVKNDDWCHSLGERTANQTITLGRKFSFLLYATLFISFGSSDCPYTIILAVVDPVHVEQPLVREQTLHRVLFSKTSLYISFFSIYIHRLVVVRLFSYTVEEADHSSISDEH